jgi:predicted ATPase/DNA-binding CsgD family transcriptional regulator
MPIPRTRLIGREDEIAAARGFLLDQAVALLTLTGPGGVGKTRLVLTIADDVAGQFADGVVWVDLAPVADPMQILAAVAAAFGVMPTAAGSLVDTLIAALHPRQTLLVLDNCEHLVAGVAELVGALLARCPALQVLATSRAPIQLHGEQLLVVEPLPLPLDTATFATVAQNDAVQLFTERARAVRPTFALTETNAATVAELCRQLDGLPLALELAAARSTTLSPEVLLTQMRDRLPLLSHGARNLPARQQTIEATIAWSYDLLDAETQALLRQLAVFVGGFTLEAAHAVATPTENVTRNALATLETLVEQSLVRRLEVEGEPRFTLLETIRAFGLARLAEHGEESALRRRHAAYFVTVAERADLAFLGPQEIVWFAWCASELGNLRSALDWSISDEGDSVLGLQLAAALWWFWLRREGPREGRERLERGLARRRLAPPDVRARALAVAGTLASFQTDYPWAVAWLEESLALYQTLDDPFGRARAHLFLGESWQSQGQIDASISLLRAALTAFTALDATAWVGWTLFYLSRSASFQQEHERARALAAEALRLCRQAGFVSGVAMSLGRLGTVAYQQGRYEIAENYYRDALPLRLTLDDRYGMLSQLTDLAYVAAARGEPERAAQLNGAAVALRRAIGADIDEVHRVEHEQLIASLRDALGDDRFAAAWAAGQARTPEQAVHMAREVIGEVLARKPAAVPSIARMAERDALTRREREILILLCQRYTDPEIAAHLFLSPRTVSKHVGNILAKLGVSSRREAAASAVRHGLV